MLEYIVENKLIDGTILEITRLTVSGECPARIVRYMMASLGYENWRSAFLEIAYWRFYYRESLAGNLADEIADYLYFAEIDGQFAARIWFAYSKRSGLGNFGNVFTEPEFRQRGLMNELLKPCVDDFKKSPAKLLACATGSKFAAQSYIKHGFELIYGGECGPLALMKTELGNFSSYEKNAFKGKLITVIRKGTPGDQFDCDKFLAYSEKVYRNPRNHRAFIGARISDYRTAMMETLLGNGVLAVAENTAGFIVGYAFVLKLHNQSREDNGNHVVDFTLHPDYYDDGHKLIIKAAELFREKFNGPIRCYLSEVDTEKNAIVKAAGFRIESVLKEAEIIDSKPSNLNIWKSN